MSFWVLNKIIQVKNLAHGKCLIKGQLTLWSSQILSGEFCLPKAKKIRKMGEHKKLIGSRPELLRGGEDGDIEWWNPDRDLLDILASQVTKQSEMPTFF